MTMVDLELDELRREFLAEAQEKAREIESAAAADQSRETLDRLAYLAHQLKGSGGSYGYQRISQEAAAIEDAAEKLAAADGSAPSGLGDTMREHVRNLCGEIDARAAELA